jgi:hypothetical protein
VLSDLNLILKICIIEQNYSVHKYIIFSAFCGGEDDMEQLLSSAFLNFIFLCIGIALITALVRKVIEFFILDNPKMPGSKTSKFWTDLFLPAFPILFGLVFGLVAKMYPWPDGFSAESARMIFSLSAGGLSSTVFRVVKSFLKSKDPNASKEPSRDSL